MTATTNQTGHALSAQDVRRLLTAERVAFGHYDDGSRRRSCATCLPDEGGGYQIAMASRLSCVGAGQRKCLAVIHGNGTAWRTVARELREGDRLGLHWFADAFTNGYLLQAEGPRLHADALYLEAAREGESMCWLVAVSVCAENGARMIQIGGE